MSQAKRKGKKGKAAAPSAASPLEEPQVEVVATGGAATAASAAPPAQEEQPNVPQAAAEEATPAEPDGGGPGATVEEAAAALEIQTADVRGDEGIAEPDAGEPTVVKEEISPEEAVELAQYDLTARLTPFLDRHLIFPIFHFLQEVGMYKKEDVTRAELQLLSDTNMIDFAVDKYAILGEEAPESLNSRREEVLTQLSGSRDYVLPLLAILEDEEMVKKMTSCKSIPEMCAEFNIEAELIENGLITFAKLQFDCGNYSMSGELLKHYRQLMAQDTERQMPPRHLSCIWGSLASFLLNRELDDATEIIRKVDEFLENAKMSKREILVQRTWLLHWTLFAIFKSSAAQPNSKLVDLFLSEKSLSIISISCPYLLRYVGACLILHKRLQIIMKETVLIIHNEKNSYSDPVTRFLLALSPYADTDMDFDEAQRELQKCAQVCKADYFLSQHWDEFKENARLHIFDTYCRIHQCINIGMIASKLNMRSEEAELWIVKLIQNAKLEARIDSEKSRVVMSKAPPSMYQQVIEKTRNLSFRSTMLLSNLEKREGGKP